MISPKIFRQHVQFGMVKTDGGKLSGREGEATRANTGLLGLGALNSWEDRFCVLVSSKAFSVRGEAVGAEMLSESDLPHWMELDTLYEFRAENDKDESEFLRKVPCKQLLVVEPVHDKAFKAKHNLSFETRDSFSFYGVEFCKDMNRWVAALRKAKLTSEERSRTKAQTLSRNVDWIIDMYRRKASEAHSESRGDRRRGHEGSGGDLRALQRRQNH